MSAAENNEHSWLIKRRRRRRFQNTEKAGFSQRGRDVITSKLKTQIRWNPGKPKGVSSFKVEVRSQMSTLACCWAGWLKTMWICETRLRDDDEISAHNFPPLHNYTAINLKHAWAKREDFFSHRKKIWISKPFRGRLIVFPVVFKWLFLCRGPICYCTVMDWTKRFVTMTWYRYFCDFGIIFNFHSSNVTSAE